MTGPEFVAALKQLGISRRDFATYVGRHLNTIDRWAVHGTDLLVERLLETELAYIRTETELEELRAAWPQGSNPPV